jgi:hypothetical protein
MPKRSKLKKLNWKPLPDQLTEDQVNIEIAWTADARTTTALERQAEKCGFESVQDYIRSMIVNILTNDEEDSALTDDGRIVGGWETIGEDGFSKNVESID